MFNLGAGELFLIFLILLLLLGGKKLPELGKALGQVWRNLRKGKKKE